MVERVQGREGAGNNGLETVVSVTHNDMVVRACVCVSDGRREQRTGLPPPRGFV